MRKIFLVLMAATLASPAWAIQFGMAGAVKSRVSDLDKKVSEYRDHRTLSGAPVTGSLIITSFKQGAGGGLGAPSVTQKAAPARFSLSQSSFTTEPSTRYGWINSGAPDYLKATLTRIDVAAGTRSKTVWSGTKEFTIDGTGSVDTSDMSLDLTSATIDKVTLFFANEAKIKGTLTAKFNVVSATAAAYAEAEKTFYTKAGYAYNAVTHAGGADSYTAFETGPAEEAAVYLSGYGTETAVEVPVLNGTIDDTHSKLTILVDLDRILRFYIGLNTNEHGGVNPTDPGDKAYFFCHSVFCGSVGAFIGDAGTVQGYQTSYAAYNPVYPLNPPEGVSGWMTLIYDAGGNFLSGMLIGDDDNSLTVAKGGIVSYSGADSDATFRYAIGSSVGGQSIFQVNDFVKQTVLNNSSTVASWTMTAAPDGANYHGEAIFKLLFQR